jgi:RHS repeat-associated protein
VQGTREYAGTLISGAGDIRYQHDACGRTTLRQRTRDSRKPGNWRYQWDADDHLTTVITPDGTTWRYLYDPLGRRIAKQRLNAEGHVTEQIDFMWDGPVLAEQVTSVSANVEDGLVTTWDYQPGTFAAVTQITRPKRVPWDRVTQDQVDSQFYAIITDLIGAPAELVASDGELAGYQQRTLWGTTMWHPDGASTPLRFPGQYADQETGLHYNYHRYYDPVSGRYLSPDPLGLLPAPNPHSYVHNPSALIDPLGLADEPGCPQGGANSQPGGGDNGGLGKLVSVKAKDPAAELLAKRIGGQPSVRFENGPPNEFDAVSKQYVAQAKPADFTLNQAFRNQAKATFKVAVQSGRIPYFQFDGPPGPGVIQALERYAARSGVQPVIDLNPLGGS